MVERGKELWSKQKELDERALDKEASDDTDAWLRRKGKTKRKKRKKRKKSQVEWMVDERGLVVVDEVDIIRNLAVDYHEFVGATVGQLDVVGVRKISMQPADGVRRGDALEQLLPD